MLVMEIPSKLGEFMSKLAIDIQIGQLYNEDMFHYTSTKGFDSILFNSSNAPILWASRYDCLNDKSEGEFAIKAYQRVCEDLLYYNNITKEMYDFLINIAPSKTFQFIYGNDKLISSTRREADSYIASFSKSQDSLAMWNYYSKGNLYEGYNIGFYGSEVDRSLTKLFKKCADHKIIEVVYDREAQRAIVKEYILSILEHYAAEYEMPIRYLISNKLNDWKLQFKSEFFKHEEEVRIIIYVPRKLDFPTADQPFEIKYRYNAGFIIPYIELDLCRTDVTNVALGPLFCAQEQKDLQTDILRNRLLKTKYTRVRVSHSDIPIRY